MTPALRYVLLWIAGSMLGVMAALRPLGAAFSNGQYFPANGDAFYHARRILDAVMGGNAVLQFDDKIHVPEGSWLTWPWGYDTVMAWITGLFGPYADEAAANRVLMNIPPAAMTIAIALAVFIARQLRLPFILAVAFVLGFASLPQVHLQFAVGNIDHHFAELLWTMGTLSAGLWFFRGESKRLAAGVTLGLVLGTAVAIHNGMFVLQIPIALTLALVWLRGISLPGRQALCAFAVALLATTALMCAFSEPWRRGFFEFYTLSWFHFYVAAIVAAFSAALAFVPRSPRNIGLLVVAAIAALIPLAGNMMLGGDFVSGDFEMIRSVTEAQSPYELYWTSGESMSTRLLSWLMWLTLPMSLLHLWWLWRSRDVATQFISIACVLGLALMQSQYRFAVFGVVPMLLTPLLAAQRFAADNPALRRNLAIACVALFAVSWYPTLENWRTRWALGGDYAYSVSRNAFPELAKLCAQEPGIVLGEINVGHWVRYHSRCSVIADVFLLTPQHAAKVRENNQLLQLTPAQLLADPRPIRYVFAHHEAIITFSAGGGEAPLLEAVRPRLRPLERDLLGPEADLPSEFKKVFEVNTPAGQVYARLFEIERD